MADKLETFIEGHLKEFDTIELPEDLWSKIDARVNVKSVKIVKSKLLSKLIYIGLSATVIVATTLYFVSQKQEDSSSMASIEKLKEILKDTTSRANEPKQNLNGESLKQQQSASQGNILSGHAEKQNSVLPDSNTKERSAFPQQDSLKVSAKPAEELLDINGVERGIFYHISYNGGPPSGRKSNILFWYTHKELPNTHFIIEQLCWKKWVKRAKVTKKGRPGSGNYSGKIPGKFLYGYKIPPHSGENGMRVVLMNDSNVCLAVSKELIWTSKWTTKVDYSIKRRSKEIEFSNETYYEFYDASGNLIKEGRGKIIPYATLDKGVYTLNYDNSTATIKLK